MKDLEKLLSSVSVEKRNPMVGLLDTVYTPSSSPEDIVKGLKWLNRNLLEDFWRDVFGSQETYQDILVSICEHLNIQLSPNLVPARLEQLIGQKVLKAAWDKMTSTQKNLFEDEVAKVAAKQGKSTEWAAAGGIGAAIAAAQLGGFSTYLLATSALAALTGSLGVALPFAAYTGLTTALGIAIGPVGWIGLGLFSILGLSGANYKKLIPAVLYIAMLRNEQEVSAK